MTSRGVLWRCEICPLALQNIPGEMHFDRFHQMLFLLKSCVQQALPLIVAARRRDRIFEEASRTLAVIMCGATSRNDLAHRRCTTGAKKGDESTFEKSAMYAVVCHVCIMSPANDRSGDDDEARCGLAGHVKTMASKKKKYVYVAQKEQSYQSQMPPAKARGENDENPYRARRGGAPSKSAACRAPACRRAYRRFRQCGGKTKMPSRTHSSIPARDNTTRGRAKAARTQVPAYHFGKPEAVSR